MRGDPRRFLVTLSGIILANVLYVSGCLRLIAQPRVSLGFAFIRHSRHLQVCAADESLLLGLFSSLSSWFSFSSLASSLLSSAAGGGRGGSASSLTSSSSGGSCSCSASSLLSLVVGSGCSCSLAEASGSSCEEAFGLHG